MSKGSTLQFFRRSSTFANLLSTLGLLEAQSWRQKGERNRKDSDGERREEEKKATKLQRKAKAAVSTSSSALVSLMAQVVDVTTDG